MSRFQTPHLCSNSFGHREGSNRPSRAPPPDPLPRKHPLRIWKSKTLVQFPARWQKHGITWGDLSACKRLQWPTLLPGSKTCWRIPQGSKKTRFLAAMSSYCLATRWGGRRPNPRSWSLRWVWHCTSQMEASTDLWGDMAHLACHNGVVCVIAQRFTSLMARCSCRNLCRYTFHIPLWIP